MSYKSLPFEFLNKIENYKKIFESNYVQYSKEFLWLYKIFFIFLIIFSTTSLKDHFDPNSR